jgi:alkanesulfonate monooxygenase SsuD/methylene tetrahydromethanopterin reductase-like flavin-dependent oxidoreductase (luciferase family)
LVDPNAWLLILKRNMHISILDNGIYKRENQYLDRINDLFEIAPYIEKLGYKRLWLGEHHEADASWRSPEVLISLLLGMTESIKIGSAGNLLALHQPLRLVQDYSLLETIFPGRVDMGLAAGTSSSSVIQALGYKEDWDVRLGYEKNIDELFGFFDYSFDTSHPFSKIYTPPYTPGFKPSTWILATGNSKFELGLKHKCNYAWSLFHRQSEYWPDSNSIRSYNELFFEKHRELPETAIAIAGLCLNDGDKAQKIADEYLLNYRFVLGGNPDLFGEKLERLLQTYVGVTDLVICDLSDKLDQKLESYSLIQKIVDRING